MPLQRDYPFTVALNVGVDLVPWSMRRGWRRLYDVKLHDRRYVLMFPRAPEPECDDAPYRDGGGVCVRIR